MRVPKNRVKINKILVYMFIKYYHKLKLQFYIVVLICNNFIGFRVEITFDC